LKIVMRLSNKFTDAIDEIREFNAEGSDDLTSSVKAIIEEYPEANNEEIIKIYRENEAEVISLLNEPDKWSKVDTIAKRLLDVGKVEQQEIEDLLL